MTETWINSAASPVLADLAEPAFRALVLAAVTGAALALLRVRRTSLKLCVWTVVLAAAFAMPMLDRLVPTVPLRVLPAVVVAGGPDENGGQGLQTLPQAAFGAQVVSRFDGGPGLETRPQRSRSALPSWPFALLVVYLFGAVALLARALIGWIAARTLARRATSIDDGTALGQLTALASSAGLARAPRLAESDSCVVPLTMGVVRPVIVLPSDWREWPATTLEAVLMHELAHVARRDALTQSLTLVHRAVFWFSPLGWWLRRHLLQLAEYASDEAVLAGGVDRTTYAEALMGFFGALGRDGHRAEWSALSASSGHVAMAQGSGPERRVARIIEWNGRSHRLTTVVAVAVVIVALLAAGVIAAIQPARKTIEWPKAPEAIEETATAPPPMSAAEEPAKPSALKVNFSGSWARDAEHSTLVSLFMDPAGRDIAVTLHLSQLADGTLRVSESWVITEATGFQSVNAGLRTYKFEIPGQGPGFSWDGDAIVVQAERSTYSQFTLRLAANGSLLLTATPRNARAPMVTATYRRGSAVAPQSSSWRAERAAMFQQLIDSAQRVLEADKVKVQIGTLAPLDVKTNQQTLDRVEASATADRKRSATGVSESEINLVKTQFSAAVRVLDGVEKRFDVGLSSVQELDDALMGALLVLDPAARGGVRHEVRLMATGLPAPVSGPVRHDQQHEPYQAEPTSADSTAVVVDVLVKDAAGAILPGLKPGEFHVFEDGAEQKIVAVSLIDGTTPYYLVSYTPPARPAGSNAKPQYHTIEVRVSRPGATVIARKGYFDGERRGVEAVVALPPDDEIFTEGAHRPGEDGAKAPVLFADPKPTYTPDAIRAKIQGTVTIEAIVELDGTIKKARVIKSLDKEYGLDDQALQAARRWEFAPGTIDGKPARFVVTFDLTFTLR